MRCSQYLLAADQGDKRWLSSCWCSPGLLLPLLSHSFCKWKASCKENPQSHFKSLLRLPVDFPCTQHLTVTRHPCTVVTPFTLIPNAQAQLGTGVAFASARFLIMNSLRLPDLWGEGWALFPTVCGCSRNAHYQTRGWAFQRCLHKISVRVKPGRYMAESWLPHGPRGCWACG